MTTEELKKIGFQEQCLFAFPEKYLYKNGYYWCIQLGKKGIVIYLINTQRIESGKDCGGTILRMAEEYKAMLALKKEIESKSNRVRKVKYE